MLTTDHNVLPNGDVTLSTGHDPIAIRAKGWHRFVLGVDLGQAHDNTALVGVEDACRSGPPDRDRCSGRAS